MMLRIRGQSIYAVRCSKGCNKGESIPLTYTEAFEQLYHVWTCPLCGSAAEFDTEHYNTNLLKVLR